MTVAIPARGGRQTPGISDVSGLVWPGNTLSVRSARLPVAAALGVVVAAVAIVPALRALGGSAATKGAPSTSCRSRLLRDWSDGRIDGTYPVACYRLALKSLPADLAVYSSAPADIPPPPP